MSIPGRDTIQMTAGAAPTGRTPQYSGTMSSRPPAENQSYGCNPPPTNPPELLSTTKVHRERPELGDRTAVTSDTCTDTASGAEHLVVQAAAVAATGEQAAAPTPAAQMSTERASRPQAFAYHST
jgi:hypothetical protein